MSDDDNNVAVEFHDKGLKDLIKVFSENMPMARVGILGGKNIREGDGSNADIGIKHEFGADGMPMRSFLRVPIIEKLQVYLENAGFFEKEAWEKAVDAKSILPLIKMIGVVGETIVLDAFQTGGFGKWKPSNMEYKKVHQTLVETQQLRNSITSDVVDK